jgi:Tol biopolymer transport system component
VFSGSPSELGLSPGGFTTGNILVKDLQSGAIQIVDTDATGALSNNIASDPVISADGRYVAFVSDDSKLTAGDTNQKNDIFRKDLQTGAIVRVSTNAAGAQADGGSEYPQISADGRFVVFSSLASNLVAGDSNNYNDIFYKDMQTGAIQLVTVTASGLQDNAASARPSISADGRYVAFYSQSKAFSPNEDLSKAPVNVFIKDMQSGELKRASAFPLDADGFYQSSIGQVTADGNYVLLQSDYDPSSNYNPLRGSEQIYRVVNPFKSP